MPVNLRSVDLNLLVVFEALVQERSVTRAASRLGITQSAVSHALRRLRVAFSDELLVRTAKGMEPTSQAVKLANAFHTALEQIEQVLDVERAFNPATARRTFHIAASDYIGEFLIPRLCIAVRRVAPDVSLSFQYAHEHHAASDGTFGGLEINFALRSTAPRLMVVERLLDDRLMVLMRRDHPAAQQPLTLEAYLALAHIKVTGVGTNLIDDTLAAQGLLRRVMVKVPTWKGMLEVIQNTDLVAAVPAHWLRLRQFSRRCHAAPLPVEGVSFGIDASWHRRVNDDPGHRWLRDTVKGFFRQLVDPSTS